MQLTDEQIKIVQNALITTEEFNKQLAHVAEGAKEMAKGSEYITPMVHVLYHDAHDKMKEPFKVAVMAMMGDFNEADDKRRTMRAVGFTAATKEIEACVAFLISEAWVSKQGNKTPHMQPRDDPARKEAMIVAGTTIDKRANMKALIFERKDNKIVFTGEETEFLCDEKNSGVENNLLAFFFQGYTIGFGLRTGFYKDQPESIRKHFLEQADELKKDIEELTHAKK